jgi:PilZ domain
MQEMEGQRKQPSVLERRFASRFECWDAPMVRVLPKPTFQAMWAVVLDVSERGLGLLLCHPLDIGTIVAIQLQRKRIGMSGILSGRVVHCAQQDNKTWRVGCLLSRNLSEEEISTML